MSKNRRDAEPERVKKIWRYKIMKKNSTKLAIIALALLIGFSALFGLQNKQKAYALSSAYNPENETVYYFFDYFPSILKKTLVDSGDTSGYDIVYDHTTAASDFDLDLMINSGYFSGFGEYALVIIDLKLFTPDASVVNSLVSVLDQQGCEIIFVSLKPESYYNNASFLSTVSYHQTDYSLLRDFAVESFIDLSEDQAFPFQDSIFFIDRSLFNIDACTGYTLAQKRTAYPFLDQFLIGLEDILKERYREDNPNTSTPTLLELLNMYNIRLVTYSAVLNCFVDIISNTMYPEATDVTSLYEAISTDPAPDESFIDPNFAAFGLWQLWDDELYDVIDEGQETYEIFLVYILLVDDLEESEDGIDITGIYDGSLDDGGSSLPEDCANLLSLITSILNARG